MMLSRRQALMTGAALPLALSVAPPAARAAAGMKGAGAPPFNRFMLGGMEVTAILAGTSTVPAPHGIFGMTTPDADFAAVSAAAFLPTDKAQFFFTPTLVNTGQEVVLFDTGLTPEGTVAALGAAGYAPDQVDIVVLTHMHPDHIGGMVTNGGPTFAKARYVTGAAEYNYWKGAANEGFDTNVRPFADKTTFIDDGGSVVSGITGMMAPGHTPGHMIFHLESAGQRLVLTADTANHYIWSLGHPDWEVKFDADKARAAQARRDVFGMLAAERLPFIGYHMPFPALGYVETAGDGFRYVPASYQMMMQG